MVLLVIDTQKQIMNASLYRFDDFRDHMKRLIKTARESGVEIIYVRHDDGEGTDLTKGMAGYEIYDDFAPVEGEAVFEKCVNSPFKESGLLEYLISRHEETVVITGLQSDYCIDASVKCAFEHGFEVIVPIEANTTVSNPFMSGEESWQYYNEFIWPKRYANCCHVDEAIEIMRGIPRQ